MRCKSLFLTLKKMTRLEKLETLVKIEEGIQSFFDRIDLKKESIDNMGGYFPELRDKNTNDIHTYMMCIDRLNERFNKLANTLK